MAVAAGRRHPVARIVSDWLDPRTWTAIVTILVGWHADGLAGAGWGALTITCAVVLPALVIQHGVRIGRYTDRHLGNRRQRLPVMAFVFGCVALSLGLLALAGAPRAVIALTVTMLSAITVLTMVTAVWKISIHCAACSGAVTILVLTFGPALVGGYVIVALSGWSRVILRDHTVGQVAAGIAAGVASALIYLALR